MTKPKESAQIGGYYLGVIRVEELGVRSAEGGAFSAVQTFVLCLQHTCSESACACTHVSVNLYMRVHMYLSVYARICTCRKNLLCMHIHVSQKSVMHVYTCIYLYMHVSAHAAGGLQSKCSTSSRLYVYVCLCVCVCACVHESAVCLHCPHMHMPVHVYVLCIVLCIHLSKEAKIWRMSM